MSITENFQTTIERLQDNVSVTTVFGDPIERGEKIVVPVSTLRYGFGGNYETGSDGDKDEQETGVGGGVMASPSGVVEITDDVTRFVPIRNWRRTIAYAAVAFLVGLILGRRGDRS